MRVGPMCLCLSSKPAKVFGVLRRLLSRCSFRFLARNMRAYIRALQVVGLAHVKNMIAQPLIGFECNELNGMPRAM